MIKDPVFADWDDQGECGLPITNLHDGSGRKRGRGAIESGDGA